MGLVPNTWTSPQETLTAEANLDEGQRLPEEQILNAELFDIPSRNWNTSFLKGKENQGELE
jgi:hypothetical protein